ncbi:related to FAS1 domain-containing protein precursor [Cephalotrichum gorgonifer]|uniref:Related to FAS1 domain-containing protein n=1 Tax=Cephalotrichum gorgonifer TaxID=2041049 RepID=A0AAE8SVT0_9PEZI|nr:related to FAS1 domain-containing protein precursor [Cephalotrichum gorgonifer]
MRPITAYLSLATLTSAASLRTLNIFRSSANDAPQAPLMDPAKSNQDPTQQGEVVLSDVMSRDKSINIFAGFTRDVECVETRLDNAKVNTTVLAPLNSAVEKLPRKPWEDPRDYGAFGADAYEGKDGEDRAKGNLRRFVEAHIVPRSPWKEGEKVQTVKGGGDIWWEEKGGKKVIQPGDIEVDDIPSSVSNGEVWVIKGVINYT